MQKLITIFVLFFSTVLIADDISDFQIEGISIGDSALDYFSFNQIKNSKEDVYCNVTNKKNCNKYYSATFWDLDEFEIYDAVRFHAKNKDKKHIIYGINGQMFFDNNLQQCLTKRKLILKEIDSSIKNLEKTYDGTFNHGADKSGKSKVTTTDFEFSNGDRFYVSCVKWSKKFNFPVTLHINFERREFSVWVTELYK